MEQIYNIIMNILAVLFGIVGLYFVYNMIEFTKELKDEYYRKGWYDNEDKDL